ncbi:MAG: sigma-54-dependent transcriptional response regulator [Candidatus Krumholzibacteriota bacterium]|nr:sigma-54-dependent transcriptional response regulator [Candidatus Krumholzibacteriota bacterium]
MPRGKILIVDDDTSIRKVLGFILEESGYEVRSAESAAEALGAIEKGRPDLVLTDIKMPGMDGIALLKEIRKIDDAIAVIVLTAFGSVETAVEAMKNGASDYLTKPISRDELTLTVEKTLRIRALEEENVSLRESIGERFDFANIVGLSPAMSAVFDVVRKVAGTDASVLITGESGTGKELFARAIHFNGPRRRARLVTVNCAAIPRDLLESELFGHVKGAFTGAIRNKDGKFHLARRGSIFLDEIGSLPPPLQAKLLRAVQEKEVQKVGAEETETVDVRVIAATNRPLPELIRKGEFREDLYYRLNVVPLTIPPLRERTSDIPLLVAHFAAKFGADRRVAFSREAIEILEEYPWPGNVRELENFCERIILMTAGGRIGADEVASQIESMAKEQGEPSPAEPLTLPEVERRAVADALERSGWNQSRAARLLGVPRHVLLYRMKKFSISRPE